MQKLYQAWVYVSITRPKSDKLSVEDLKSHLSDAVTLDVNTEDYEDIGVDSVDIDWESLRPLGL